MKKLFCLLLGFTGTVLLSAAPFTPGNLVIYRTGNGTGPLVNTGNPVFLDEYTPSGVLVQSVPLPTAASGSNLPLIASGTATSEGLLTLSSNTNYLVLTGYGATPGGTINLPNSTGSTIPRVVGLVDYNGVATTSTGLTDFSTANNPRSAISTNGVDIWVTGGAGGPRYATVGATTSTQISSTTANLRQINIFSGQLYTSTSSGTAIRIGTIGTGISMETGQTITNLPGFPTSVNPYSFVFFDENTSVPGPDVLYVADDGVGVTKYSLVSGSWVSNGTVGSSTDLYRGITASYNAVAGVATFFATRKGGGSTTGGGELVTFTDASGYNLNFTASIPTLLATATPNTAFRGIAFAPGAQVLPLQLLLFAAAPKDNSVAFTWKTANERNTHHFDIEQSPDGNSFKSTATVAAAGNSTSEKSYTYIGSQHSATTYYRLRMVDVGGKSVTSSIIKLVPSTTGFSLGNVYPVPAKNSVTVEWNSNRNRATILVLTDRSGRTLRTINIPSTPGFNQYQLNVSTLTSGQYFLRLKNGMNQIQTIITKQ